VLATAVLAASCTVHIPYDRTEGGSPGGAEECDPDGVEPCGNASSCAPGEELVCYPESPERPCECGSRPIPDTEELPSCEDTDGELPCDPEGLLVPPSCDPDGYAPCPDDYFVCTEDGAGVTHCWGQEPASPDDGTWLCEVVATTLVCFGDHYPSPDGLWFCDDDDISGVVCRSHRHVPDLGIEADWSCFYDSVYLFCEMEDAPDGVSEGCCVPGAERYCEDPGYPIWGTQRCLDDGVSWGPCDEIAMPPSPCDELAGWYSPAAEECCVRSGFCCLDMWDLDGDGDTWESLGNCVDVICS
jgi:hypothetical protein